MQLLSRTRGGVLADAFASVRLEKAATEGSVSDVAKHATVREGFPARPELEVALLTGGFDKPYVFGLTMALVSAGICLDVIGGDDVDSPEMHARSKLRFLNLRGSHRADTKFARKALKVLLYYARLIRYATVAEPKIFHILWNNKFQFIDRTLLMLYYKLFGKRIALTAHNVNAGKRDSHDGWLNRLTLRIQYRLADHIFVHTEKMKNELLEDFGVCEQSVTVVPFGINNSVPYTDLTCAEAKRKLDISTHERAVLFFGNIGAYKGLEFLVAAFQQIAASNPDYRLLIVGKVRGGADSYLAQIQRAINGHVSRKQIMQKIEFVPDHETEVYFKAADVLVLPYTRVSQSGVLFLGYNFGLPVVATDVGSLRENIVEGKTGFLCRPNDPIDLARKIEEYFESDLYKALGSSREKIREYVERRHSWALIGETSRKVYLGLMGGTHHGVFDINSRSCPQRAETDP
jgi:D-inositol-3-phosphate glycosyltransferase